jgi:formylglycine-generating enzyme required for sulfatase activity
MDQIGKKSSWSGRFSNWFGSKRIRNRLLLVMGFTVVGLSAYFAYSLWSLKNTVTKENLIDRLELTSQVSLEDGAVMIYIPAGEFEMGSEDWSDREKPVHFVTLDAY